MQVLNCDAQLMSAFDESAKLTHFPGIDGGGGGGGEGGAGGSHIKMTGVLVVSFRGKSL